MYIPPSILSWRSKWSPPTMRRRQAANPQMQEAVDVLRAWNGQMQKGTAAPMITSLIYDQIRKQIAERAATGMGDAYHHFMAPSVVERLLRERPADWFPDYDALLLRCLTGALEAGKKIQGSKVSRWDYGQYMSLEIVNPVEGRLPLIGRFFNIGPVSMSGAAHHREAVHAAPWVRPAHDRRPGRSGSFLRQSGHRRIRPGAFFALQRPVGRLLRGPQLSPCSSGRWTRRAC